MPIETFPNNGSADKAGKWKERELQIFNPSPSESNLGRGKKKVKILHQNTLLRWICLGNFEIVKKTLIYQFFWIQATGVACTLLALLLYIDGLGQQCTVETLPDAWIQTTLFEGNQLSYEYYWGEGD